MGKLTINGIDCYGEVEENSNFILIGDWANGQEMEDDWCPEKQPANWTEATAHIKKWADDNGHDVVEMQAV